MSLACCKHGSEVKVCVTVDGYQRALKVRYRQALTTKIVSGPRYSSVNWVCHTYAHVMNTHVRVLHEERLKSSPSTDTGDIE